MADNQPTSSGISLRTILFGTAAAGAILAIGGAIWFDNKRRSDPELRKKLAKQKREAAKKQAIEEEEQDKAKAQAMESARSAAGKISVEDDEPAPTNPEEREQYFMEQLQKGEMAFRQGPEFFEASAAAFYKAMKVYPNPMDLLVLFQRSVPEPVFNMLMEMMAMDMKKKQEEYFETYPKKEMKVRIKQSLEEGTLRRGLAATEDFEEGQVIFTEVPLVGAIDAALESDGFCSYCATQIPEGPDGGSVSDADFDKFVYCSEGCRAKAHEEYNQYIVEGRTESLKALFEHCQKNNVKYPLMIMRFLGRMVAEEKARAAEAEAGQEPTEEVSIWEHLDKLQYIDIKPSPEDEAEGKLVTDLMTKIQPGFDEFFTEERYRMIKGKMLYNGIAVQTVEPPFAPPSTETVRLASSSPTPVGAGLYFVASYASHSCEPSARIEFREGNNTLSLVASKAIKAGEDVTVAYVPVMEEESREERQARLAKGYRFKCECTKCGAADGIDE